MLLRDLTEAELHDFIRGAYVQLNLLRDHGGDGKHRDERELLNTMRTAAFYGCRMTGVELDGHVVSLNATKYQIKPRKNAWGRYINWLYAYTLPTHRRMGYATALQRWVEEDAVTRDYHRLKSLAGSWLGFRLHRTLGHHIWGVAEKGELLVETPLCVWRPGAAGPFPTDTVPYHARAVAKSPGDRLDYGHARVAAWEAQWGVADGRLAV